MDWICPTCQKCLPQKSKVFASKVKSVFLKSQKCLPLVNFTGQLSQPALGLDPEKCPRESESEKNQHVQVKVYKNLPMCLPQEVKVKVSKKLFTYPHESESEKNQPVQVKVKVMKKKKPVQVKVKVIKNLSK